MIYDVETKPLPLRLSIHGWLHNGISVLSHCTILSALLTYFTMRISKKLISITIGYMNKLDTKAINIY